MDEEKNIFERLMGMKSRVAEDIFWGTSAIMFYILGYFAAAITSWSGCLLVAAGANCVLLVIEVLRFRVPLFTKEEKAGRRIAVLVIAGFILMCLKAFADRNHWLQ